MCDPVTIAGAVISLAGTAYSVNQQKRAAATQRQAQEKVDEAQQKAADEANRIAQEQLDETNKKTTATNVLFKAADSEQAPDTRGPGRGRFAFQLFDQGQPIGQPSGMKPPTLGI